MARKLVTTKRTPLPLAYRVAYVLVSNVDGEYYAPAAAWGFDSLGRGAGLCLYTARLA